MSTRYHKISLPKITLFLTTAELLCLLQGNSELFRKGLERGKAFNRAESKNAQYEKKLGEQESQFLNKIMN